MREIGVLALVGVLGVPSAASACGGFFCNVSQPVDQSAEEIVFDVDHEAGTVEMTVKITYSGPSDDFAWVVPVPQNPELAVGTDALFPVLSGLRAQWILDRDTGICEVPSSSYSGGSTSSTGGGGVQVVASGIVGPYETVTLAASDSTELVAWLQDNGFDLPSTLDDALAPYVADGQFFVALKLAKDRDAGDLQPLSVKWQGSQLAIPIQLTSLSATPDMGLRVYVLGDDRAVPLSYFHLEINELAVDWWSGGSNIEQVLTRAADEAGGHGFFTDYAGPTDGLAASLWSDAWSELPARVAAGTTVQDVMRAVIDSQLPLDDDMLAVLADGFDLPDQYTDGFDLYDVLNCVGYRSYSSYSSTTTSGSDPGCSSELAQITFDPAALATDLEDRVLEPRHHVASRLEHSRKITRMTSSVSPTEMTVDPTFVFNPDLPDQDNVHRATERYDCTLYGDVFDAPRTLVLSDGREVPMPSINRLAELNLSSIQWLEAKDLIEPVNVRIEQMDDHGPGTVLVDNSDLLWSQLTSLVGEATHGCGCATGASGAGGGLGLGFLTLGLLRRRVGRGA